MFRLFIFRLIEGSDDEEEEEKPKKKSKSEKSKKPQKFEYLIKWTSLGYDSLTWESEEYVSKYPQLVKRYKEVMAESRQRQLAFGANKT